MSAPATAPPVTRHQLDDRAGGCYEFEGQHLGSGTSYTSVKDRWFEVDLYRRNDDGRFVVYTRGMSRLSDEVPRIRLIVTSSAFEIIELLTVHHNDKTYIPRQSARALAQAAQWDDDVRDAYVNRAVT